MDTKTPNVMNKPKQIVTDAPENVITAFMKDEVDKKSTIIQIDELTDYIDKNLTKIIQEQNSVPYGKFYNCSVAKQPENVNRNRYSCSEPYNYNRVILKVKEGQEEGSEEYNDYIASSHIDSFSTRSRFIAAQAPLPETINDFWRMIWDYNCSQIVTLTQLIEKGLLYGDKYWPDGEFEKYGNIVVTRLDTNVYNDFEVINYELEKNSVKKRVEHYFYYSWLDCTQPDSLADSLLNLMKVFKESKQHKPNNPAVIQCSAGVGRTGTFILVYNMIEMGEELGFVDIYKYFIKMRHQRAYAVFEDQYLFSHKVIAKYFSRN